MISHCIATPDQYFTLNKDRGHGPKLNYDADQELKFAMVALFLSVHPNHANGRYREFVYVYIYVAVKGLFLLEIFDIFIARI